MITTDELVKKIKNEAPRVEIECAGLGVERTTRFVVEGDIGLTEAQVLPYAAQRIQIATAPDEDQQGLIGIERDGKILRWRPGTTLTYTVWRPTFPDDAQYQSVVDGMASATADWQSICGIEFEHLAELDTKQNLQFGDAMFPVVRQSGGGTTIAMAFFPDDEVEQRLVWVFDGYFGANPSFDPVGVMRHELGHSLGFRHEHIAANRPDLFDAESTEHTVAITAYDPKSVMHYVAADLGDPELRFTELDREGARRVYGGPFTEFSFA